MSESGIRETEIEASKFEDFDLVISSPFRRARETATIFAEVSQCDVVENELLREVDVGDYELCKYETSDSFLEKHGESIPYPNGESLSEARSRTIEFFEQTNQTYNNKRILIVTHGWIVFYLIEHTDETFDAKNYLDDYDEARQVVELGRSCRASNQGPVS